MMRDKVQEIFMAGVAAADPRGAVARALRAQALQPTHILAIGKAAVGMAGAALDQCPHCPCLIVTNPENSQPVTGATVLAGAHPVPTADSAAAGQAVLDWLAPLGKDAHVLALISGGGSALCVAPVAGISLADKAQVNAQLLASGLPIQSMNLIRQALSRIKGGGLLRAAAPARVTSLILSDVVGDDLRAIASGPTVAPLGNREAARDMLVSNGLWEVMPPPVRTVLEQTDAPVETPETAAHLVGSNALSVQAMAAAAAGATLHSTPLEGDVAAAADHIAALARRGPGLHLLGGETTVILRGTGRGGRNQELALRVAGLLADLPAPFVFLSGGTDGRDGPTDVAGGVVDNGTWARIGAAGHDVKVLLANNDSYAALEAAGDLLRIPATGTNVADLQVLWVGQSR